MKMKFTIFNMLILASVCMLSCDKDDDAINFRVQDATQLEKPKATPVVTSALGVRYQIICQDSSIGCGTSYGPLCDSSTPDCKPILPLRLQTCPDPAYKACVVSMGSSPICPEEKACNEVPPTPVNHPIPCIYGGSVSVGCFSGWTSGPYCTTLINCEPPN